MALIQAHEVAARAQTAGMTIDEMCARAGVQRAVFDAWRGGETVDAAVSRSLLRVVENAERGGDRPNVPVSKEARLAEIARCREILGWGMPTLSQKLGIPLPQALKINVGKTDVSDADIDYMQRLVAAIEAVPRVRPMVEAVTTESMEDDDMALRQQVIDEAVAVYLEAPAEGDEAEGARWAIGQLLARLGLLGDARAKLQAAKPWAEAVAAEAAADDGVIGRVPFRATEPPAPGPV
jgi:hypothetical protein